MSGSSNVLAWLERMAISASKDLVDYILHQAKQSDHILSDDELSQLVRDHGLKIER